MSKDIRSFINAIEKIDFVDIDSAVNQLRKEFPDWKDLIATLKRMILKIHSFRSTDIARELRFLIKNLGHKTVDVLKSLFRILEKKEGKLRIFIINKELLTSIENVQVPEGIDNLSSYTSIGKLPRNISVIVTKSNFLEELIAVKKIFSEIFNTRSDWLIAFLAADHLNEQWPRLETYLIKESALRPVIREIIPLIHIMVHTKDKPEGFLFVEDMVRRLGITARSWKRSIACEKKVNELIEIAEREDSIFLVLKALYLLSTKEATLHDFCSLIFAILPIDVHEKKALIYANGCSPDDNFLNKILEQQDLDRLSAQLASKLMDAERRWAPEVSVAELLGISWLTYISSRLLREWLENKIISISSDITIAKHLMPEDLLDLLKLALVIYISDISCKQDDCELVVRMLFAIRKRFIEYPISLLSYIAETLCKLPPEKFSTAIILQRILEIHGYLPYLYLLDKIFAKDEYVMVISLQTIAASRLGLVARKAIALAMKNINALKIVNDALLETNFTPHGITAPLYWELTLPLKQKLFEMTKLAIQYYEDCGIKPGKLLRLLYELLALYPSIEEIKEIIRERKLFKLQEAYINLAKFSSILELIRTTLRATFGTEESPLLNRAKILVSNYTGILNDIWERELIKKYNELISKESECLMTVHVSSKIKEMINKEGKPVILLVIDGLRIDDYLVKLKDVLLRRGFTLREEKNLLSLLPSITTISRRAIFGGEEVLKYLVLHPKAITTRILKEEDYLKKNFGDDALYLHGAVRHINNVLRGLERENRIGRFLAIVLSELEKAAHGATEGFLARISYEYALEVGRLVEFAAKIMKEKFDEAPLIFIASDHGLGLFTKVTETDVKTIIRRLKIKGFLDPAYECYISERFAIIPVIGVDLANSTRSLLDVEFGNEIYTTIASELRYQYIVLKIKGQEFYEKVPAKRVLVLFPRGKRRFIVEMRKKQRVVLHGGVLPVETIVPFAIYQYKG